MSEECCDASWSIHQQRKEKTFLRNVGTCKKPEEMRIVSQDGSWLAHIWAGVRRGMIKPHLFTERSPQDGEQSTLGKLRMVQIKLISRSAIPHFLIIIFGIRSLLPYDNELYSISFQPYQMRWAKPKVGMSVWAYTSFLVTLSLTPFSGQGLLQGLDRMSWSANRK